MHAHPDFSADIGLGDCSHRAAKTLLELMLSTRSEHGWIRFRAVLLSVRSWQAGDGCKQGECERLVAACFLQLCRNYFNPSYNYETLAPTTSPSCSHPLLPLTSLAGNLLHRPHPLRTSPPPPLRTSLPPPAAYRTASTRYVSTAAPATASLPPPRYRTASAHTRTKGSELFIHNFECRC